MSENTARGDQLQAYCKVCKQELPHTVIALRKGKPSRVQCQTCEDPHPYRASAPAPRKSAAAVSKRFSTLPVGVTYASLMEERNPADAVVYAMQRSFATADMISHPVFGLGLVTRTPVDGKMEVLFEDGMKKLACAR